MKAILTCVDYGDILAQTLPYNRHHFDRVVIVTTPADEETQQVAKQCDCELHVTADFYKNSASFNKWIPLEQGLDLLGRDGLICIMDADIAWPKKIPQINYQRETLYSPRRYLFTPLHIPPESEWDKLPIHPVAHLYTGYTQIFHGEDKALGAPPWHMFHENAGGPDSLFQKKYTKKQRMPFKVLHLGPTETNWGGRITPRADGTEVPGAEYRRSRLKQLIEDHRRIFRKATER